MNTPTLYTANKTNSLVITYFRNMNIGSKEKLVNGLTEQQIEFIGHLSLALKEGEPRIPLSA